MQKIKNIVFIVLINLFLIGCGGGSSDSTSNDSEVDSDIQTAYLKDHNVSGVSYSNNRHNGFTNSQGRFNYAEDTDTIFSIGGIILGNIGSVSIHNDTIVYPTDLLGIERTNPSHIRVIRVLQLLQSLDSDQYPNNGIDINETTRTLLADVSYDFRNDISEEDLLAIVNLIGVPLISQSNALAHFRRTLVSDGILSEDNATEDNSFPIVNIQTNRTRALRGSNITFSAEGSLDNDGEIISYSWKEGEEELSTEKSFSKSDFSEGTHTIMLTVVDDLGAVSSDSVSIIIYISAPSNSAPTITSNDTVSVEENQTVVLTITSTDSENDTISYSITGGDDQAKFSIDVNTGELTFQLAPDYESPTDSDTDNTYNIEVTATDNGVGMLTDTQTITVTVTNVLEMPSITSSSTVNVAENETAVLTVTATDPEHDTITYSITGGADQAKFTINSTSGVLSFQSAPDYESQTDDDLNNIYIVEVTATDDGIGNLADTQTITVTVTNIGEHYILNAVYDDKRTTVITDDILYLYMNEEINPTSFNSDSSLNYDIVGTGVIGSSSSNIYTDTIFHRHKIELTNTGTASSRFVEGVDTIKIKANQIEDVNGLTTTVNTTATVEKFNVFARLKTGQTTSSVANDDGAYQSGVARSYTNNGDGTVTDNATGLIWQQEDDDTLRTLAEAETYCNDLDLGGSSEWRLATIEELMSLTDKGRIDPAINPVFTNTRSLYYWSYSAYGDSTASVWVVSFNSSDDTFRLKTDPAHVRCVRSSD